MEEEQPRTLWCGNLDEKVTSELLYELFLQAGPLSRVTLPRDKSGKQRNYAFIVYEHECAVPYAKQLFEGTTLFKRQLRLQARGGDNNNIKSSHQRSMSCPSVDQNYGTTPPSFNPLLLAQTQALAQLQAGYNMNANQGGPWNGGNRRNQQSPYHGNNQRNYQQQYPGRGNWNDRSSSNSSRHRQRNPYERSGRY